MLKLEDKEINLELAKLHLDRLWEEVFWRRNNEQKVVLWTFGLVAALLSLAYSREEPLSDVQRNVLAGFMFYVGLAVALYLWLNFLKVNALAQIIVRINKRLGAWKLEGNKSLYPNFWEDWGNKTIWKDAVTCTYLVLVLITTVLGMCGLWIQ